MHTHPYSEYTHVHTHVYIYAHICMHTHIHEQSCSQCTHMCMCLHIHTHVHVYQCIPTHEHLCPGTAPHKYTQKHKRRHECSTSKPPCTPTYVHIDLCTLTYKYIHRNKKEEMSTFKPSPGPLKQNVHFKMPRQFPGTFKLVSQFEPAHWAAGLWNNSLKILNLQILKAQPRDSGSEPRGAAGF